MVRSPAAAPALMVSLLEPGTAPGVSYTAPETFVCHTPSRLVFDCTDCDCPDCDCPDCWPCRCCDFSLLASSCADVDADDDDDDDGDDDGRSAVIVSE